MLTRSLNDLVADNLAFAKFVTDSLKRHASGDWGELSIEDKQSNDVALIEGLRVFSAYSSATHPKIWIITEADRSATTILFPDEY